MPAAKGTADQPGQEPQVLKSSLVLGRWHGVEVDAHWSVLATLGLFVISLATLTLPEARPGETRTGYWLVAVATAIVFLLTLLAHELAHAAVARAHGMRVERITLWMLGGVTMLGGPSPTARAEGLVALAGPATSLGIGAVCIAAGALIGTSGLIGTAIVWLGGANVILALFNLLPGSPLDGGRVVTALLWWRLRDRDRAVIVASQAGKILGYLIIAVGLANILAGFTAGLWLILIGWFILSGAAAEQSVARDEHLVGLKAGDVMAPAPFYGPAWWTVAQFIAQLPTDRIAGDVFPVVDLSGRTTGVITLADLEAVPRTHRTTTRISTLADRHGTPVVVATDADVADIASQIRPRRGFAVVTQAGRPCGVISMRELSRAVHLTLLGWRQPTQPPSAGGPSSR